MRTTHSSDPRARQGYVLIMTLVFLGISLLTLSSVMWWAASSGKVTRQNELFTTAESAADAATEQVVATLDRDWAYSQTLQAPSVYAALVPSQTNTWASWPMKFQFSNGSGNNGKTGVTIGSQAFTNKLGSQFASLSGYVQLCTIISTATTVGQSYTVSATVKQTLNATIIPLFQFAIFYNMNLEIDPGAAMSINGPVFSNGGIWAGTPNVTFNSTVAAGGLINTSGTDPWASGKTDSGTPLANFALAPLPNQDSLTLPVGNNTNNNPAAVEAIINLPVGTNGAPNPFAYTTNGQMYMFNASDLIVSNPPTGLPGAKGTNIVIWYQDPNNAVGNNLTQLQPDVTNVVGTVTNKFFSFATNVSYYDYREKDTVQAVQIDVSKLNTWLTNASGTGGKKYNATSYQNNGHGIRSIYVYNNVPSTSSQLPAVRLVNGKQLPSTTDPGGSGATTSGLTVATPQPLYVKGNYNSQTSAGTSSGTNTANTYPAALIGDAITILSTSWSDANTSGTSLSSRTPVNTTINAACMEGIVQSTNSNYSGGVENFLRLEEDWSSSITLTYNGSITVMFPSIYATSFWPGTGSVYNPPKRNWGFDYNFTNPNKLPPLTPKVYRMIRAGWKSS